MLRRPFGNSGLSVPVLGFGAMQIGDPQLDDARNLTGDPVHDEYRRRFATMRASLGITPANREEFALRFVAFAPGVDRVIVGGIDATNVDRNVAAVRKGALEAEHTAALQKANEAHGRDWRGLV